MDSRLNSRSISCDDLAPPFGVELDLLLLVERVVLLAAPVGVVRARRRRASVVTWSQREVRQHRVGVDVRGPAPHEDVVVPRDLARRRAACRPSLDTSVAIPMSSSHSVTNSRIGAAIDRLGALGVAELERAAAVGHLAHAVAVGVEVAGVVEDLVGAVGVVGDTCSSPRSGTHAGRPTATSSCPWRRCRGRRARTAPRGRWRSRSRGGRRCPAAPGGRRRSRPAPPFSASSVNPPCESVDDFDAVVVLELLDRRVRHVVGERRSRPAAARRPSRRRWRTPGTRSGRCRCRGRTSWGCCIHRPVLTRRHDGQRVRARRRRRRCAS